MTTYTHDEIEASLAEYYWSTNDSTKLAITYVRQLLDECKTLEQYKHECLNLRAVIHRDGGHHTVEVGLEVSVIHANKARNDMLLELDALRAENERLKTERDAAERAAFDRWETAALRRQQSDG